MNLELVLNGAISHGGEVAREDLTASSGLEPQTLSLFPFRDRLGVRPIDVISCALGG